MPESSPEVAVSIALALKSFQVVRYEPSEDVRPAVGYNFRVALSVNITEISVALTVSALGTPGELSDLLATFESLTTISIAGLQSLPHPAPDSILIPDPIMANIVNIAVGASRGALAVVSAGRFLFPLMDAMSLLPKEDKVLLEPS